MRVVHITLLALLAPALAGCLGEGGNGRPTQADASLHPPRPVVVALIDTGINPYHGAFHDSPRNEANAWATSFAAEPVALAGSGDYEERVLADKAFWDGVEDGRLYAFAGTRVMGITFSHDADEVPLRDDPVASGHGTATASIVAREAPDALIVLIQIDVTACEENDFPERCPIFAKAAPAMAWAAEQPWIDVISVSMGLPGNPPSPRPLSPEVEAYLEASRLAHQRGKLLVNAAGNLVVPPLLAHFAGSPWVIAAGGAEPAQQGEAAEASRGADVVANYTEWAAQHTSIDAYEARGGTSFSGPVVAGTLARALQLVREAENPRIENDVERAARAAKLRHALNASATTFALADWNPTRPTSNDTLRALTSHSAPILLAPAQMGWGYVHAGLAPEIARRVLEDDLAPPPEKAQTAEYMAQWQSLRETYWQNAS